MISSTFIIHVPNPSTGNKPPAVIPNKFMYMSKDLNRLRDFFEVPLQYPSDPLDVMFNKGRVKQERMGSTL